MRTFNFTRSLRSRKNTDKEEIVSTIAAEAFIETGIIPESAQMTTVPEATTELTPESLADIVYSINKKDHSVYDGNEKVVDVYFELISINGSNPIAEKINNLICNDYEKFLSDIKDENLHEYVENGHPNSPYEYTMDAEVMCQDNGVLSILYSSHWYMGGVYNKNYSCSTFSLDTGDVLSLRELYPGHSESEIYSFVTKQIFSDMDTRDYLWDDAKETVSKYSLDEFEFYCVPYGEDVEVVICFETYELACGAEGPQEFRIEGTP